MPTASRNWTTRLAPLGGLGAGQLALALGLAQWALLFTPTVARAADHATGAPEASEPPAHGTEAEEPRSDEHSADEPASEPPQPEQAEAHDTAPPSVSEPAMPAAKHDGPNNEDGSSESEVSNAGASSRESASARPAAPVVGTRDLRLRFRVEERGAAEITTHRIFYTLDGGQNWSSADSQPEGEFLRFRAGSDGRYGFALGAADAAGLTSTSPQPGEHPSFEVIVDTQGPAIRLVRPDRLETVAPDSRVEVEWEVQDDNIGPAPVEISASLGAGPWEILWGAAPARGKKMWQTPLLLGEVKLRVRARDLAGNVSELVTPAVYQVTNEPFPASRWVAAAPTSRSRRVPLYYRFTRDLEGKGEPLRPEELRKVQLWFRADGLEWSVGPNDPDRRSPLLFEAPNDGWFEIVVGALDAQARWTPAEVKPAANGRPESNLAMHTRFLVDTTEPRVKLLAPRSGAWIEAGSVLAVEYSLEEENPRDRPVSISSSLDGGTTWTVLAEGLEPPPSDGDSFRGEFRLRLPAIETETFLVRVTALDAAGNTGESATDAARPITIARTGGGRARKAEEHYRRGVLEFHSTEPRAKEEAMRSFRQALAYEPNHAPSHHDLAVALETAPPSGDAAAAGREALEHFRKAFQAAPDDPRFAFSLVGALLKRAQAAKGEEAKVLRSEATQVFEKISWSRLAELAGEREAEGQRLRRQYREWKEQYFSHTIR